METLNDLRKHMEWADAAVWTAVLACEEARKDPKLRERLYHLHLVQYAFLRIWRGESPETPYPVFDEIEPLLDWSRAYCGEAAAFLPSDEVGPLQGHLYLPYHPGRGFSRARAVKGCPCNLRGCHQEAG